MAIGTVVVRAGGDLEPNQTAVHTRVLRGADSYAVREPSRRWEQRQWCFLVGGCEGVLFSGECGQRHGDFFGGGSCVYECGPVLSGWFGVGGECSGDGVVEVAFDPGECGVP